MAKRRKPAGLDPQIAEAAIQRAVAALVYDAVRSALHDALAGVQAGAQQAVDVEGCNKPSELSVTVGRAVGAAARQAFDDLRDGVIMDTPASLAIRTAVQEHVFQAVRGALSGAVALHHSIAAAKAST